MTFYQNNSSMNEFNTHSIVVPHVVITGSSGDDVINGGVGVDFLSGGDGNDTLSGNAGTDYLDGGNGDDVLNGGYGADNLTGGAGKDTFVFNNILDWNVDTITDFNVADDKIAFDGSQYTGLNQGVLSDTLLFVGTAAEIASGHHSAGLTYATDTGALGYINASGVVTPVAQLTAHLNLSHTNFFVM